LVSIVVIDTGGANLASVVHAVHRLGAECSLTGNSDRIRAGTRVILPGVGSAGAAMAALREAGLVDVIRSLTQPVLGICLGLQLMYERSEEGDVDCLGLIPGKIEKLVVDEHLRLPHMGWNQLHWNRPDDSLARGVNADDWYYFVHSYGAGTEHAIATCEHGQSFAAVVRKGNFAACQFHPEKSAGAGARILANFLETET
jgi:imidazole glycerol-phosphate synthase subunit HisH